MSDILIAVYERRLLLSSIDVSRSVDSLYDQIDSKQRQERDAELLFAHKQTIKLL